MTTLILSSSWRIYKEIDGIYIPQALDNENSFLDNLRKLFTKRNCWVEISGNPIKNAEKTRAGIDNNAVLKKSFEMVGLSFKEYIFVDDTNKMNIKEYIDKADVINLRGGHGPTCNAFVNELHLKDLLKNFDGIIIGESGGAMNMADKVYFPPEREGEAINPTYNRHYYGIAKTNINILPHFNEVRYHLRDGFEVEKDILLPDSYKYKLLALNNGSYIIQQNNNVTIYGESYIIHNGEIKQLCQNNNSVIYLNN